jgi:hypothetical protein
MSELDGGVPCPQMRRAALQGDPVSHSNNPYVENATEAVAELQARSLRHRFARGYYLAATLAHLAFAVSR